MTERTIARTTRTRAMATLAAGAIAGLGFGLGVFAGAAHAETAPTEASTNALCTNAWNGSDADDWCDATISVTTIGNATSARCDASIDCSITLTGPLRADVGLSGTTSWTSKTTADLGSAVVCAEFDTTLGDDGLPAGWQPLEVHVSSCQSGTHIYTPGQLESNGFTLQ